MANTIRLYHFVNDQFGCENLIKRRLKVSFSNEVNDLFEMKPFNFGGKIEAQKLRSAWNIAIRKHSTEQGFISFTEDWSTPTMWAHYADNHKGICLGFDLPIYDPHGTSYADKIEYVDDLVPLDERVTTDRDYNKIMVKIARSTKSAHW